MYRKTYCIKTLYDYGFIPGKPGNQLFGDINEREKNNKVRDNKNKEIMYSIVTIVIRPIENGINLKKLGFEKLSGISLITHWH